MSEEWDESPAVGRRLCPIVNGDCLGRRCLKIIEKTETWTNEGCMGGITYHSRRMLRCSEFPDTIWWQLKETLK